MRAQLALSAAAGEQIPGPLSKSTELCPYSAHRPLHRNNRRAAPGRVRRSARPRLPHQLTSFRASTEKLTYTPQATAPVSTCTYRNSSGQSRGGGRARGLPRMHFLLHLQVEAQPLSVPSLLETQSQHRKEICPLFQILLHKNACLIYPENLTSVKWTRSIKNIVC